MIEKTDDILINKGNSYLIVDKNGDLVKVETNGDRIKYPKQGGDTTYTAGSGLLLTNKEFSIDDTVALKSEIKNSEITFTQGGVTKGTITLNQNADATIALDAGGGSGEDEKAIHIWNATVGASGVVTLSGFGAPPVSSLNIGDQIIVSGDVYRKARNSSIIIIHEDVPGGGEDENIIIVQQSNNTSTPGVYIIDDEAAQSTARVWKKKYDLSGNSQTSDNLRIEFSTTNNRWELKSDLGGGYVYTYSLNADDSPLDVTWVEVQLTLEWRLIDNTSEIAISGAGSSDCNGTYTRITPSGYNGTDYKYPCWINLESGGKLGVYDFMIDVQWIISDPQSGDPAYEASGSEGVIDPTGLTWYTGVWGSAPVPTLTFQTPGQDVPVEVYDRIEMFNKLVDSDSVMQLDWDNAENIPASGVVYQAKKAGIIVAKGRNGSLRVYASPISISTASFENALLIGNSVDSTGEVIASTPVGKGQYYFTIETVSTLNYRKFIPYKL